MRWQYKHRVASVFVLGLFLDLLDTTIVNVALPTIAADLGVQPSDMQGVATAYLIALATVIPVSGWAGDHFGTKQVFVAALALFTSASGLCSAATNLEMLVAFRALQGIGGGLLVPVGVTMLMRANPPDERASASAVLAVPAALAPALGPLLGGYLVEAQGWRWIFAVNVPVGLVGIVFAACALREHREGGAGRLDLLGFSLSAGGLAATMYALAIAAEKGLGDREVAACGSIGLALLVVFAIHETRTRDPLIDLGLFRERAFAVGSAVTFLAATAFSGALFLLPLLLQQQMRFGPMEAGMVTFAHAAGILIVMPVASGLYARLGVRTMLAAGMGIMGSATLALTAVDGAANVWPFAAPMLLAGVGYGLTIVPLQVATFSGTPPEALGRASAAFNSVRQVALGVGVSFVATTLAWRLDVHAGAMGSSANGARVLAAFHEVFELAAGVAGLGMLAAWFAVDRSRESPATGLCDGTTAVCGGEARRSCAVATCPRQGWHSLA